MILTGLPGDEAHASRFSSLSKELRDWLVDSVAFPEEQVLEMPEPTTGAEASSPLTAETIRSTLQSLCEKLDADDTFWLITVGHGSYDGKRAWFHVAGRDPSDADLAGWLSPLRCRQQVLWLTHSSSGWMVKALSRPGRIVIAASAADDEPNETEFPEALVAVAQKSPLDLRPSGEEKLTVADLFSAVAAEVERRFKRDSRLPTEHAQLDDNGDAKGSETLAETDKAETASTTRGPGDGQLARATVVFDVRLKRQRGPKTKTQPVQPSN
ncbi:MAG TPA: hypothetical protein VFI31_23465 [Pirellulales bacterium]|nr:hypothetical protein [Pirellulales bacterium]